MEGCSVSLAIPLLAPLTLPFSTGFVLFLSAAKAAICHAGMEALPSVVPGAPYIRVLASRWSADCEENELGRAEAAEAGYAFPAPPPNPENDGTVPDLFTPVTFASLPARVSGAGLAVPLRDSPSTPGL